MHIITRSASAVESKTWQILLRESIRKPQVLLQRLGLDINDMPNVDVDSSFSMLVPEPFMQQMAYANADDPLLRQVLPVLDENQNQQGYSHDPLGERDANQEVGIVHKYHGRLLVMLAAGCVVNCRYCFRRHFPYTDNRVGKRDWSKVLRYIQKHNEVSEVILSGGDPLLVSDERLEEFIDELGKIAHIQRLRIHTRLPIVIPQRLTPKLKQVLTNSRLKVAIVLHCNHKNELSEYLQQRLLDFQSSSITLLNQSVLLKGVNDNAQTLIELSEKLFNAGVLPYYLHLLDLVQGAAHFYINDEKALAIYKMMQQRLPGYLLPKLAREEAGETQKTVLIS